MNRPIQTSQTRSDRLLARWGGIYVVRMQSFAQLVSFVAAAVGVVYVLLTANFNVAQTTGLIAGVLVFVTLVNLIIPLYTAMATPTARLRLDAFFKGKKLPAGTDETELENRAWQEIIALPGRYAFLELVTAYLLVVLPTVLFMIWVGGASSLQAAHVAIGGLVSGTGFVIQNTLFLDRMLAPVRRALLPRDITHQDMQSSLRVEWKLQVIILFLVLSSVAMLVTLGYQTLLDTTASTIAGNLASAFIQRAAVIGGLILISGIVLGVQLSRSLSQPIAEMARTMDAVHKGGMSQRATIITSDETAKLTIRLNQLLDELEVAQHALERQVSERTADLSRRTLQLQAAAQVAHDASLQTDIDTLLSQAVNLISDRFGYYHTGIFLIDEAKEYAVLQAASSEGGKQMIARGHRLAVGQQGIVGATAYQNRPHVAMDVGADAVYTRAAELPLTSSEAAMPLAARGVVIGVLDIQSTEKAAFSQEDIELLQTMADQIALAIQNARLITESQEAIQKLEVATAEDVRLLWKNRISGAKRSYRYTSLGLTAQPGKQAGAGEIKPNQMTVPITLRGQRIGTITVNRKEEAGWGEADRSLAIEVANQIGLALENARLLDDAQRHAAQEQSLSELTAHLSRSLDSDTILQTVVRELHQLPSVEEVSVFLTSATKSEPPKETL